MATSRLRVVYMGYFPYSSIKLQQNEKQLKIPVRISYSPIQAAPNTPAESPSLFLIIGV
jgi:hypothetical protein